MFGRKDKCRYCGEGIEDTDLVGKCYHECETCRGFKDLSNKETEEATMFRNGNHLTAKEFKLIRDEILKKSENKKSKEVEEFKKKYLIR